MPIKLLKREEISRARANDQAKEIAEGLKLSRKVDSLREMAAKEERDFEKFRNESLAEIGKEIGELESKRSSLISEVKLLQDKLDKLSPKMATDRRKLIVLQKELSQKSNDLEEKEHILKLQELDLAELITSAKSSLERQKTSEETAEQLKKVIEDKTYQAIESSNNARRIEENAFALRAETERELGLREKAISVTETKVKEKEEENVRVSRELEMEKVRLADQRRILERAMDRLKKNRLA